MVHNEILITLTLYYKLVGTQDDGSYYIVYISLWQSLHRACTYARPRQRYPFSHTRSMKVEEDSFRHLVTWKCQNQRLLEASVDMRYL